MWIYSDVKVPSAYGYAIILSSFLSFCACTEVLNVLTTTYQLCKRWVLSFVLIKIMNIWRLNIGYVFMIISSGKHCSKWKLQKINFESFFNFSSFELRINFWFLFCFKFFDSLFHKKLNWIYEKISKKNCFLSWWKIKNKLKMFICSQN